TALPPLLDHLLELGLTPIKRVVHPPAITQAEIDPVLPAVLIDLPIRHASHRLSAEQDLAMPGFPDQRHDHLSKQAVRIDLLLVHQGQTDMHHLSNADTRWR